jgi:methylmalonyl-CoA mutase
MPNLLSEFPAVSTDTWEKAIAEDLKGANYAEKLIWHSPEGVDVKPYYRAEDIAGLKFLHAGPGEYPYVRGSRALGGWRIREEIDDIDPEEANSAARRAIAAGAEEIAFTHAAVGNASDLGILLKDLGEITVRFENASPPTVRLLVDRLTRRQRNGIISADLDWSADSAFCAEVIAKAPEVFVPFTVSADQYQENGATAVEEIGFALADGVDYLTDMQQRGADVAHAADSMAFSFAVGPEYFMQIAKLRAFRMVWAQAVENFGVAREHAKARVYAHTSRWNRTIYDPHVNILRATMEAMSALLGGADSVCVTPFASCYRPADEASRRLARNTQIILKQEAQLARVADPGGGSYYLEALTDSVSRQAWKQFQDIESAGGFRKATEAIAQTLAARRTAREKAVISRRCVLTGTNRFANAAERALDHIDGAAVSDPVRAAVPFEALRLRTERYAIETGKLPRILLAEIGDVKMRAARSNFVSDFLACAGLASDIHRFETPEEISREHADLIVLCSSDPEYPAIATGLLAQMKSPGSQTPILIAGNPEAAEQLRSAGVTEFIHLRSNPIELLTKLQQILGIGK